MGNIHWLYVSPVCAECTNVVLLVSDAAESFCETYPDVDLMNRWVSNPLSGHEFVNPKILAYGIDVLHRAIVALVRDPSLPGLMPMEPPLVVKVDCFGNKL